MPARITRQCLTMSIKIPGTGTSARRATKCSVTCGLELLQPQQNVQQTALPLVESGPPQSAPKAYQNLLILLPAVGPLFCPLWVALFARCGSAELCFESTYVASRSRSCPPCDSGVPHNQWALLDAHTCLCQSTQSRPAPSPRTPLASVVAVASL